MTQLLKITTTPIEYKVQTQSASINVTRCEPAKLQAHVTPLQTKVRTDNIKVLLDTTKARSSIGLKSAPQLIVEARDRGLQAAQDATAQYAEIGNQMAQIHTNQTIPDILAQRLYQQPTTMTVFLPSSGVDISWKPNKLDMDIQPGTIRNEWEDAKLDMEYVPSKFQISVLQYPKVTIEYLGTPNYVPKSADPNYSGE